MLYKYCPNCFSLDLKYENGKHKCNACNYIGDIKSDSIDQINAMRKRMMTGQAVESNQTISPKSEKDLVSIGKKIKSKFGEKSKNSDWELL